MPAAVETAPYPPPAPVILLSMTYKVGPKGQVVIPKSIRDRLGIEPGDEVLVEREGDEVRIRRQVDDEKARRERIEALRGIWADRPGTMADFEAERRRERELEEKKIRRHLDR